MACSFLILDRDADVLRKQVMAGVHGDWQTRIQLSLGRVSIGAVRTGLAFVHNEKIADAKLALHALKTANVGVYQRNNTSKGETWSREQFFPSTDKAMGRRGWVRLVGVMDKKDTVLVYVPADFDAAGPIDVCVSVLNCRELVVVSATVDAAGLAALMEKYAGDELKQGLKLARF